MTPRLLTPGLLLLCGLAWPAATAASDTTSATYESDADPLSAGYVLPTETCGDLFLGQVSVNGSGPYPMIIDTGAPKTVVTPRVAREARLRKRIKVVELDRFRATGKIPYEVQDLAHLGHVLGVPVEGILGYPVFKPVLLTFDYPAREVRVQRGRLPEEGPGIVAMARGSRPFVAAYLDGHDDLDDHDDHGVHKTRKVLVKIDTGATGGLYLRDLDELDESNFAFAPRRVRIAARFNGFRYVEVGRLANDVRIGPFHLGSPVVNDAANDSLLGASVLHHFAITLDQRAGRLRFARAEGPVEAPLVTPPYRGIGAGLRAREEGLEVVKIFEGLPAARAGLREGDRIVSIDGRSWTTPGCRLDHDGIQVLHEGAENKVLTLERDGETLELTVPIETLVP